jgi:ethanolamine utilization protein EutQ
VPAFIARPAWVEAAGNKPKLIDEYVGRVNSAAWRTSIAHMRGPGGWQEPGQPPVCGVFVASLTEDVEVPRRLAGPTYRSGEAWRAQ